MQVKKCQIIGTNDDGTYKILKEDNTGKVLYDDFNKLCKNSINLNYHHLSLCVEGNAHHSWYDTETQTIKSGQIYCYATMDIRYR